MSETVETIQVHRLPSGNIVEDINVQHPDNREEIAGHRKGEFAIGSSKAQHFIQHMRDVDLKKPGWRDEQEKFAEAAQLAICEELTCPACSNNCKMLTNQHWDINRIMQGHTPKNKDFIDIQKMICNSVDKFTK